MKTTARMPDVLMRFAFACLLAIGVGGAARAQDDLPGRAGRLADLGGRVFVSTEENPEDWVEALRNYTITSGDNVWVAADGRAEIDYGGGQFRLAGDTNIHVARLDDSVLALFVAQGRAIVRVRVVDAGESVRVDTPNTQLALNRPGLYRIEVSPDRDRTTLVVREGEATAVLARGAQQVLPGQSATLAGDEPDYAEVRNGFFVDGFDTWSAERDRRYERSRSASYVSRQMIGYADLDDHGAWETYPEYGAVWFPRGIASDWAPYRYGRWTWVSGWGWTWVDDAPWGYAPFHYGRWAYVGTRWGWIPGGYVARPVWAPALVAWYGGPNWSISAGAPVFGWVALGWGEPYLPAWRNCSHRCWTMYNRPYAVNYAERPSSPPTRYANWSAPGGVTAVPSAVFTGRQPVHSHVVALRPQAIGSAPILSGAPVIAKPSAGSIPGAKPTMAAPPPAERFIRKPLQFAPSAPLPSTGAPTWGGGQVPRAPTSAPPARQPAAPGQVAKPPSASTGAPPATYGSGTWGAPVAPRDARPVSPSPQAAPRVTPPATSAGPAVPSRPVAPATAAPPAQQQGIPMPRNVPPATSAGPGVPSRPVAPATAAPPAQQQGIPMPRSAPPAAYTPPASQPQAVPMPRSAPPSANAPQLAPQPHGMAQPNAPQSARPAPPNAAPPGQVAKPVPRERDAGDKPGAPR